jgi:hypothetical protein
VQFEPVHIFEQLFLDNPELARQAPPRQLQLLLQTLLMKLSGARRFSRIGPVLVLNGHKQLIYKVLQATSTDRQKLKATQLRIEDSVDVMLMHGDAILGQRVREELALELFCFSVQ